MATPFNSSTNSADSSTSTNKTLVPSKESQALIVEFLRRVQTEAKRTTDYFTKMEVIDIAYARYKGAKTDANGFTSGEGIDAATTPVGVTDLPSTTPPVLVSQVDSMVGYLADVFLSGSPLFPVVSSPEDKKEAEQLETMIDDHAILGGYARQLLMFLRDGVKYNISALEAHWDTIEQYSVVDELLQPGVNKVAKSQQAFTKLKRIDPYNLVWDNNVAPGDIAAEGDYAGYMSLKSRTKMKRFLQRLADQNKGFNIKEAMASNSGTSGDANLYYRMQPQISEYIATRKPISQLNWFTFLTGKEDPSNAGRADNFEYLTLYARIIPEELKLAAPMPKTVQIWKFVLVNSSILVSAERVISAYDMLPILFGQPLEDGLGYQTQSTAEGSIPFQQAASTLFNISFNAARRAVADRALYDPMVISSTDINAPVPAAKIPVRTNSLVQGKSLADYYHQIPFDARGTEGALQSGMQIVSFGKELSGLNAPQQGQFQKGNKSVQEWNDTMGGSDSRLRLPAITLEHQVFQPLKYILALNIYQFGENATLVSQKTGKSVKVDIQALRSKVLSFRLADGYTPKSKLASTDSILQLMQMISQSQLLQQSYGAMLPGMVGHLAQLMGIRGLEEYTPAPQQVLPNQQQTAVAQEAGTLAAQAQQPSVGA